MGKIIAAQSMVIATAGAYEDREAGKAAVGSIFRTVFWHSLLPALLVGLVVLVMLVQAQIL